MARDDSKLAFSSAFRYMRVHMKGSLAVTTNGSSKSVTHSLGYLPYTQIFVDYPDVTGLHPIYPALGLTSAQFDTIGSEYDVFPDITASSLTISVDNDFDFGDSTVVNVYYRIYAEPQT